MASAPRTTTLSRRSAPVPPPEAQPDDVIGEFRRGKEIGKGSFATVYLAQHRVCHMCARSQEVLTIIVVEKEVLRCCQGRPNVQTDQET